MITSIGTVIDSPTTTETFLWHLLEDTRKLNARTAITVLTTSPVLVPALAPLGSVYLPPAALSADCDEAIAFTLAALGGAAADLAVAGVYGDLSRLASDLGKTEEIVDLFVIGPRSSWDIPWLHRNVIESLLLGSGTPLMLLPDDRRLPKWDRIVLGWQPSAEAVRSAHDLVALAKPGAGVDIVTIGAPDDGPSNKGSQKAISDFLLRHGFSPVSHWIDDGRDAAEQLQDFAVEAAADLLAVGGFGHSRIREIILGGVTHGLISEPRVPVLLSH
jgi:nucleotide-binding universal stress UspA family protein